MMTTTTTAEVFNAAIGAASISAAFELGLLERLHQDGRVTIASYCIERDLHRPSVDAILRALAGVDVVVIDESKTVARPGPLFRCVYADKGYFLWLTKGYGYLWQYLGTLARNASRPFDADDRDFVKREGQAIAAAGKDYGASFVDPHFFSFVDLEPFEIAADLGCGSAARLVQLALRYPGTHGVGVEVNGEALSLAAAAISTAGLGDRIQVVRGDVRALTRRQEFDRVDLIVSFFMGHDLWPRERCARILAEMRETFPAARRFLLCDTYRNPCADASPIFSLGFEVTHAVMGQSIPTEQEWLNLFEQTSWQCVDRRPIDIPFSTIFDLRPRS